jgi:hypothetical protein
MRSSFSLPHLNEFCNGLLLGKERLGELKSQIKVKKADAWDGKDFQMEEEEDLSSYEDVHEEL